MGKKAISNEEIIAALIQHGTIKEAAKAAGTTPRTIYDRMSEKEFAAEYQQAKNGIIRKAVFAIDGKLSEAINTISDLMNNKDTPPAIRLQAAQTILNNAEKFACRLSIDERQAIEKASPTRGIFDFY